MPLSVLSFVLYPPCVSVFKELDNKLGEGVWVCVRLVARIVLALDVSVAFLAVLEHHLSIREESWVVWNSWIPITAYIALRVAMLDVRQPPGPATETRGPKGSISRSPCAAVGRSLTFDRRNSSVANRLQK